jgi:protein disulfide isomerase
MNFFKYFILSLFYLVSGRKKLFQREETVIVLNDDNFNKTINKFENILVLFYATWCGHCKKFLPTYVKTSQKLYDEKPRINLAKIEMSSSKEIKKVYNISSFPTIKFFQKGKPYDYDGERDEESIIKWMKKKIDSSIRNLTSHYDISTFRDNHDIAVMYFGDSNTIINYFNEFSEESDDVSYAYCTNENIYSYYGMKKESIIIYKDKGKEKNELNGKLTKENILKFMKKYSFNKLLIFNKRTAKLLFEDREPALILFVDSKKYNSKYENVFYELSKKLYGRIRVYISDYYAFKAQNRKSLSNVKENETPCVRIYDPRKNNRTFYRFTKEINEKNLLKFADDFEKGNLKFILKSDEIVEVKKNNVVQLVGKNFENEVLKSDFNYFVFFYLPYFDQTDGLLKMFDEVNQKYRAKKQKYNLKFGKINMYSNEVPPDEIPNIYPTFRIYLTNNKNNKKTFEITGNKEEKDIMKFLDEIIEKEKPNKDEDL